MALRPAEVVRPFTDAFCEAWDQTGVPIPTHFPHTFELWQHAGGAFAGMPEEARQFVAQQVEAAGLDTMNFHLAFGDIGLDDVCRTAELFATEVMPAFADAETLR